MLPFLKARIGGANIDMLPNPFSFATVGGQNPNVDVASAAARITGISVPVPVSCNAGSFRILDAAGTPITGWVTFGTIKNNQHVQLLIRSSNAYSGQVGMTVYVGKGSAPWYVNTVGVTGGSAGYGTPGQYGVTIPHHNVFNFDNYGAGGGGGGSVGYYRGYDGGAGGYTQTYDEETGGGKLNVIAWGGGGGAGGDYNIEGMNTPGAHGSGQGGNVVYAGGAGGGAGAPAGSYSAVGGTGGTGGRCYYSVGRGLLTPGTRLIINVGAGGAAGAPYPGSWDWQGTSYAGGNGAAYISWG